MKTHVIRARIVQRFSGCFLAYDVIKKDQVRDRSGYGVGAAEYIDRETVVATVDSEHKAVQMRDALNKWDGSE